MACCVGGPARWSACAAPSPSPRPRPGATILDMDHRFDDMTAAERILYVQDLWDRIAQQPCDVPVSEAWKAELSRRLEAHRADPTTAVPWEQVVANLRRAR